MEIFSVKSSKYILKKNHFDGGKRPKPKNLVAREREKINRINKVV